MAENAFFSDAHFFCIMHIELNHCLTGKDITTFNKKQNICARSYLCNIFVICGLKLVYTKLQCCMFGSLSWL